MSDLLKVKQYIKRTRELYPEHSNNLEEALNVLNNVIGNIIEASPLKVNEAIQNRKPSASGNIKNMSKINMHTRDSYNHERTLNQLIKEFKNDVEPIELTPNNKQPTWELIDIDMSDAKIITYEKTKLNYQCQDIFKEPNHKMILDDYPNKKLMGYTLYDEYTPVSSWEGLYADIVSSLYETNPRKLRNCVNNNNFRSQYHYHMFSDLSAYTRDQSKPFKIAKGIYIDLMRNEKNILSLILALLIQFQIKPYDFKLCFKK